MDSLAQSAELLSQIRDGDKPAFKRLLTLHHPKLHRRAMRRLAPDLRRKISPEDILQEVYLEVARRIGEFKHDGRRGSFYRWLCAILQHKLIDAARAYRTGARDVAREVNVSPTVQNSADQLLHDVPLHSTTPSQFVSRTEQMEIVIRTVAAMPGDHGEILRLRYLQAHTVPEAAKAMGRSEPAIHMLTRRALETLATELRSAGLGSIDI